MWASEENVDSDGADDAATTSTPPGTDAASTL